MGENNHLFADADSGFEDADIILLGVPFDGTSSHRSGSASAPSAIRKESYNFESYLARYNINLEDVKFHDMGDSDRFTKSFEMMDDLPNLIREVIKSRKFLITMGGEHSITVPVVKTLLEFYKNQDFGIIYLDAHLDFRESYLNNKYSHACVVRRLALLLGFENIVAIGTRSFSKSEARSLQQFKLRYYDADTVSEFGIENIVQEAMEYLDLEKIYLSIDMDVLDPAYAPGVGNPEYFGLTPWHIRKCIEILGPHLISADIVEVSPPYDNGNTAALAAQFIQIIISQISLHFKY